MSGMAHLTDLWLARRGRRAALRFVRPYVERTRWRRGSDPGSAWMEAYALGFLAGLITLVARPVMGRAGGELLGLVQAEVWAALTGLPAADLGERLLTLSLARDPDFAHGLREALAFHAASFSVGPAALPRDALAEEDGPAAIHDLWDRLIGFRLEAGPVRPLDLP